MTFWQFQSRLRCLDSAAPLAQAAPIPVTPLTPTVPYILTAAAGQQAVGSGEQLFARGYNLVEAGKGLATGINDAFTQSSRITGTESGEFRVLSHDLPNSLADAADPRAIFTFVNFNRAAEIPTVFKSFSDESLQLSPVSVLSSHTSSRSNEYVKKATHGARKEKMVKAVAVKATRASAKDTTSKDANVEVYLRRHNENVAQDMKQHLIGLRQDKKQVQQLLRPTPITLKRPLVNEALFQKFKAITAHADAVQTGNVGKLNEIEREIRATERRLAALRQPRSL